MRHPQREIPRIGVFARHGMAGMGCGGVDILGQAEAKGMFGHFCQILRVVDAGGMRVVTIAAKGGIILHKETEMMPRVSGVPRLSRLGNGVHIIHSYAGSCHCHPRNETHNASGIPLTAGFVNAKRLLRALLFTKGNNAVQEVPVQQKEHPGQQVRSPDTHADA